MVPKYRSEFTSQFSDDNYKLELKKQEWKGFDSDRLKASEPWLNFRQATETIILNKKTQQLYKK